MKSLWTKHLKDSKQKDEFKALLLGNKEILRRLDAILGEMITAEDRKILGPEDFSKPNWSELQAYRNGRYQAMQEIKSLLEGLTE